MLFLEAKKEALAIHEGAVKKYNTTLENFQREGEQLYLSRQLSVAAITEIEFLINSIANTPKEFEKKLFAIEVERIKFRQTEEYAAEAYQTAIKGGAGMAAGAAGGAAIAAMAPTVAMWVATTFGTASTGTAISTLSGAVATKAALAWLGGGALTAGGGGMAAGKALLALAGPIGWGIAATTVFASIFTMGYNNKKISEEAVEEAKEITIAGAQLRETETIVAQIHKKTKLLLANIKEQLSQAGRLREADYSSLDNDDQLLLGALVNNTLSLAEMLNKTVSAELMEESV